MVDCIRFDDTSSTCNGHSLEPKVLIYDLEAPLYIFEPINGPPGSVRNRLRVNFVKDKDKRRGTFRVGNCWTAQHIET